MSQKASGKKLIFTLGASVLAAVIAVRGTLSIIPDSLRYDRYGDTHGFIVIAMYFVGIVVAFVVGKAIDDFVGEDWD